MNFLDTILFEERAVFLKSHEILFSFVLCENRHKIKELIENRPDLLKYKNPLYQTPYIFAKLHNKERVYSILKTEESEKDWEIYQRVQNVFVSIREGAAVFDLAGYNKQDFSIPDIISRNSAIFVAIDEKKKDWIKALYPFCKNDLSCKGLDVLTYTLHVYPKIYKFIEELG